MKGIRSLLLLVLICCAPALFAQQLPRIIILATGGTIAGQGAATDRAKYASGKIPVDDLIAAITSVKKIKLPVSAVS
jgi:L-asparaginase